VKCSCLNWVVHSKGSSSLLSRTRIQCFNLRERKRGAQDLDLKESIAFSEWPTAQGGRWGSIYSPHLKESRWREFHRTSPQIAS
jgi:hypothetical protein